MKSLCIKENNQEILKNINDMLSKIDLDSIIIKNSEFKNYKNIILHYTGTETEVFYDKISKIISEVIITFYEKKLLKRLLEYNYFYFNSLEKKEIIDIAQEIIESDIYTKEDNFLSVCTSVLDYITKNKVIVLEGFVNFRLQNYMKNLDYIVDISVNKFITDKEYLEFVNMLKLYVTLTPPKIELVHLIYLRWR